MILPYVERFGTYQANGEQRKQSGVLRINCIDCLDRTNVVQGWLARKQLDHLLSQLSLLPQGSSIREAFPEVRQPSIPSCVSMTVLTRMSCAIFPSQTHHTVHIDTCPRQHCTPLIHIQVQC